MAGIVAQWHEHLALDQRQLDLPVNDN